MFTAIQFVQIAVLVILLLILLVLFCAIDLVVDLKKKRSEYFRKNKDKVALSVLF